jgi:hypothetical protein
MQTARDGSAEFGRGRIASLAAQGYRALEIAEMLDLKVYTVEKHCREHGITFQRRQSNGGGSTSATSEAAYERKVLAKISKPTFTDIAKHTLGDNVRFDANANYLWTNGRWLPATVTDIMRRVNTVRKRDGFKQIDNNHAWIVN